MGVPGCSTENKPEVILNDTNGQYSEIPQTIQGRASYNKNSISDALRSLSEVTQDDSIDLDVDLLNDNFNSGPEDNCDEEQCGASSDSDKFDNFDDDGSLDS